MDGEIPLKSTFVAFATHRGKQTCIHAPHDMALYLVPASAPATALQAPNGYFIATASSGAQLRAPGASDYYVSKHALSRLEFGALGELAP